MRNLIRARLAGAKPFAAIALRLTLLFLASVSLVQLACGGGDDQSKIRVQLDWTPNTNHIGVYLAQAKGWYKDAGIKVKILPYTDVNQIGRA